MCLVGVPGMNRVVDTATATAESHLSFIDIGRIGEVAALRWKKIHPDRIEIGERF